MERGKFTSIPPRLHILVGNGVTVDHTGSVNWDLIDLWISYNIGEFGTLETAVFCLLNTALYKYFII